MDSRFSRNITVMPSQVDSHIQMSIPDCFGEFMNAATLHAEALGIGMAFLLSQGMFWLTVRSRIHFYRRPKMLETVEILTWPEQPEGMRCNRQYAMAKGHEILAVGRTEWAIMNTRTGRLSSVEAIYPEGLDIPPKPECMHPYAHIDEGFDDEPFASHTVVSTDIDFGGHMNNVAYIRALAGAFSLKEWEQMRICEAEVVFRSACYEGDVLRFQKRLGNGYTDIRASVDDGRTILLARLTHGEKK